MAAMTKVAKLHPTAELSPTKAEIAAKYAHIDEIIGSYRAVDPDDEVGIEVLLGHDYAGNIVQFPVTYRAADNATNKPLCAMDHSVLGKRSVARAEDDPVAITQWVHLVQNEETSATYSTGPQRFHAYGTGGLPGEIEFLPTFTVTPPEAGQLRVVDSETGTDYLAARLTRL